MLNSLKIDIIESINILNELAQSASPSLPDELCRFFTSEFNLKYAVLAEEKSHNIFNNIGKSSQTDFADDEYFSIENFDSLLENSKYENEIIKECNLTLENKRNDLQSFAIFTGQQEKFVLILAHKISPSSINDDQLFSVLKFVKSTIKLWKNIPRKNVANTEITSLEFLEKSTLGITKEIKTSNGLITLVEEEQITNTVANYIDEIRKQNKITLSGVNELNKIIDLNSNVVEDGKEYLSLSGLFDNTTEKLKSEYTNLNVKINNLISQDIYLNKTLLEQIIYNLLEFTFQVSTNKIINVNSLLESDKKLKLSIEAESLKFNQANLVKLAEPFENKEFTKQQSGLALTVAATFIDKLNGTLKFNYDGRIFSVNISLPTSSNDIETILDSISTINENKKDKILVIESDNASSTLLKNYLTKWEYSTEFVSSGNYALNLIKENKYVAIILNVEQENGNSLELIQKIKNSKLTRNTPVIVFSVEAEKEKVYTMGSIEYLVKPINYNHLVEILTSYKLRQDSTVLCVDDDLPTLNLVKQAIQTAGFNVISNHRPELVINQIKDKDIELAIIDLDMPITNGFELIKEIKSLDKFSKLPIIIYTGKEDYQEDLKKIDGMFVDLLDKKSTSFSELENTIVSMIKQYEQPTAPEATKDESSGPKILMAEDYKHSQIIVTRLLKKSGFENVIVVENGEEAYNICENDKVDLILMDMQMPVMNGFEATGKIRELPGYADTPVIALTAFAMKGDREKCLEAGATDYIPKPIDSKEFIEKVKYYTQANA